MWCGLAGLACGCFACVGSCWPWFILRPGLPARLCALAVSPSRFGRCSRSAPRARVRCHASRPPPIWRTGAPPADLPPGLLCLRCRSSARPALSAPPRLSRRAAGISFRARSGILMACRICPPYDPPMHSILHRKSPRKFVQKNLPTFPPTGELGSVFGPIDGPKKCRYHPRQAEATRPPPSEPPQAARPRRPGKGR